MSIHFLSTFVDWIICIHGVKFFEFFICPGDYVLSEVLVEKIFSHSVGSLFTFLIISFDVKKLFSLIPSHLLILDFTSCALGVLLRKLVSKPT